MTFRLLMAQAQFAATVSVDTAFKVGGQTGADLDGQAAALSVGKQVAISVGKRVVICATEWPVGKWLLEAAWRSSSLSLGGLEVAGRV